MKILILSHSLYEGSLPKYRKNRNGFSLMMGDIVRGLSQMDEVCVSTYVIDSGKQLNRLRIADHSIWSIIKGFRFRYFVQGVRMANAFPMSLQGRLRYLYYWINKGCIRNLIGKFQPDIVSIHGVGYRTKPFLEVCQELGVKYTVTLHGLIGLDESVRASAQDRKQEKDFLRYSEENNIPVSVISSGMKARIVQGYGLKSGDNIHVILNGTELSKQGEGYENVREKYGIAADQTVAVCVGNVTPNKNQIQVVRAYHNLDPVLREKLTILFPGKEVDGGKLRQLIEELGYEKNLILCGFVPRETIGSLYAACRMNIFASLNDGFGLPIVEGFVYAVPAVTFADLDATPDLYDDRAVVLSRDRSDEALAQAMTLCLGKTWEQDWIRTYAKKFSLQQTICNYHQFFERESKSCTNLEGLEQNRPGTSGI